MILIRVRVNRGAMAIKGYSAFPKALALLKLHHQIVKCHIKDNLWGDAVAPANMARMNKIEIERQMCTSKKCLVISFLDNDRSSELFPKIFSNFMGVP